MGYSRVSTDWMDKELVGAVRQASGPALAACAKVVEVAAKANIRRLRLPEAGGYFKTPGAIEESCYSGQFHAKDGFTGGFLSTTSLWWIIEYGALFAHRGWKGKGWKAANMPHPWLMPAVQSCRDTMLSICEADIAKKLEFFGSKMGNFS